jgi:hypothetical protein
MKSKWLETDGEKSAHKISIGAFYVRMKVLLSNIEHHIMEVSVL